MLLVLPPYIEGVLYSLFFLLALGPAFFYLISLAINKGLRPAVFFAIGIILSDVAITSAVYFGMGKWFEEPIFKEVFSLVGGIVVLIIGLRFLFQKTVEVETVEEIKNRTLFGQTIKGFLMNVLNPFAFIVWVTLMAKLKLEHPEYNDSSFFQFFVSFFIVLLVVELGKATMAHKIRVFLTKRVLFYINKILGLIFIGVGIWLFLNFINLYFVL